MKKERFIAPETAEGEICAICGKPIGYGERFSWSQSAGKVKRLIFVHEKCVVTRGQKKGA